MLTGDGVVVSAAADASSDGSVVVVNFVGSTVTTAAGGRVDFIVTFDTLTGGNVVTADAIKPAKWKRTRENTI